MLYAIADQPGGAPGVAALVASYLFHASIALWVYGDAVRRGAKVPYDFDSFVYFTWPVTAPAYLLRSRGARGCGIIILFLLLIVLTIAVDLFLASREIPD
jgi:hypothetical protein